MFYVLLNNLKNKYIKCISIQCVYYLVFHLTDLSVLSHYLYLLFVLVIQMDLTVKRNEVSHLLLYFQKYQIKDITKVFIPGGIFDTVSFTVVLTVLSYRII